MEAVKLNLGCGGKHLDGFVNVDIRPSVNPDKLVDLMRFPWPWSDGSVKAIESYHVLEHLDKAQGLAFLDECHRVLECGGRLVLELPNVLETARELVAGNKDRIHNLYGLQRNPYDYHRYGYWPESLSELLESIGFDVTYTGPGTDYHAEQEPCMRIEGKKR